MDLPTNFAAGVRPDTYAAYNALHASIDLVISPIKNIKNATAQLEAQVAATIASDTFGSSPFGNKASNAIEDVIVLLGNYANQRLLRNLLSSQGNVQGFDDALFKTREAIVAKLESAKNAARDLKSNTDDFNALTSDQRQSLDRLEGVDAGSVLDSLDEMINQKFPAALRTNTPD